MVVDSSAFLCILLNEPERERFSRQMINAAHVLTSSATYVETCIAFANRLSSSELHRFDDLLQDFRVVIVGFTEEQAIAAREAWLQYGRGNHKAKLNFGDCFSYALSKVSGQPLLYKGKDFSLTDVKRA